MSEAPERIWAFEDEPGGIPRGGWWCDEQSECPNGSPEYIRAGLVPAPSVTVKPLEWEDDDDEEPSYSLSVCGAYLVELSHDGNWYYWDDPSPFATIEAAKAAAQADYEARILAAVQIGPRRATPETALREALERCREIALQSEAAPLSMSEIVKRVDGALGEDTDLPVWMFAPAPGWQPIETAPRDQMVLLAWLYRGEWKYEAGLAGSTRGGWLHGQATHWMPLPAPPSEDQE